MDDLKARLPRLSRLLMFESAARHLSFTLAARELGITQAAVSQQIRALEQELGVPLFNRLHRGLEITRQGQRLRRAVSMALAHVADAADEIRAVGRAPAITIGVTFAIATFWLVPRLARFRARFPDVEVHLVATDRGFDKVADRVDAGVAFGSGSWPGFTSTLLEDGIAFPVCSPAYLAGRTPLRNVEDLFDEILLSIDDDRPGRLDWPFWFAEVGADGRICQRNVVRFNSHPLLLQAACEGQGVALGWNLLTDDLLRDGRLVRPVDAAVRTRKGYYFVVAEKKRTSEIAAFEGWLMSQFEGDRPNGTLQA